MHQIPLGRSVLLCVYLCCFTTVPALAQLDITAIPFAPNGSGNRDANGAPIQLTSTTFLVTATGPDLVPSSADDLTLLVSNVGGTPVVTPIATPFMHNRDNLSGPVALSATRALVASAGPDGDKATGDELVYLLDDLGGANTVTSIFIGHLNDRTTWKPIRLSDNSAAMIEGEDHTGATTIKLLTDLGGANTVTTLPAPFLRHTAGQPVALSSTSLMVPMAVTEDLADLNDVVYLFTDLGGTNTRTDISTPYLNWSRPGVPVPISPTRVVIASDGLDATRETADDGVYLLDDLGGTNAVTFISIPFLYRRAAGGPVVLNPDLVLVGSEGPDGMDGTADDRVFQISDIGNTNTTSFVVVPGMDADRAAQPVRLSATSFVVTTEGPDLIAETADDSLIVVSDVGTLNTIDSVTIGGLGTGGVANQATAITETSIVIGSGGPDNNHASGLDDVVNVITGLPDAPVIRSEGVMGRFLSTFDLASQPRLLGASRAMFLSTGPDGTQSGASTDDLIIVVELDVPPEEATQQVLDELDSLINANPGTSLADKLEDAQSKLQVVLEEFAKSPPDNQAALGNLEGAVGELEAAVNDGLLDAGQGNQLMDQLTEIARVLAVAAIDEAIAQGGDAGEIGDAQQAVADGDTLRDSGAFKDAVNKYKDALAKAESALP